MSPNNGGLFRLPAAAAAVVRKHAVLQYVLTAVIVIVSYLFLNTLSGSDGGETVEKLMLVIIGACAAVMAVLAFQRKLTHRRTIALLFIIGFTLRIGYMLYTPFYVRQHDLGNLSDLGHVDYIYTIATKFRLPDSYYGEFYHPPFYYILAAAVYDFASLFSKDINICFNLIKIIPCFASCATLLIGYKIFGALKFSAKARIPATALIAVHPAFIYLSASINNDMPSIFFMALTLLYTIKWFYRQSLKNAVLLAVALGLGMMTKLSVVLMAPVIAAVFVYVLIKKNRTREIGRVIQRIALFAVISVPLGMWYQIRNYVRFGQPLGYVLKLSTDVGQYCGNRSIISRFFSLPLLKSVILMPYGDAGSEYNLWTFILKSSLFGEWKFPGFELNALILDLIALLLIAESLFAMIYVFVFVRGKKSFFAKCLIGSVWLVQMLFFVYFNVQYPFGCTMDFRYIVITLLTGAAFLGLFFDSPADKHPVLYKTMTTVITISVVMFAVYSVWFYTNI